MALSPVSYWTPRLLAEGLPNFEIERAAAQLADMDRSIGEWICVDDHFHLIEEFMPGGDLQGKRKLLSYDGAIEGRDPGNYCYGVALRNFCNGIRPQDARYHTIAPLNDETLGDIIEAILGLLWNREHGNHLDILPHISTPHLQTYVEKLMRACLQQEQCINFTAKRMNLWLTSRELSRWFA